MSRLFPYSPVRWRSLPSTPPCSQQQFSNIATYIARSIKKAEVRTITSACGATELTSVYPTSPGRKVRWG